MKAVYFIVSFTSMPAISFLKLSLLMIAAASFPIARQVGNYKGFY